MQNSSIGKYCLSSIRLFISEAGLLSLFLQLFVAFLCRLTDNENEFLLRLTEQLKNILRGKNRMKKILISMIMILTFSSSFVNAEQYNKTRQMFIDAGAQEFFNNAYGYAIFPTIAKAGFGIGGSYGEGKVYKQESYTGETSMAQITIGLQIGGQAFSQIIFLQDKRSFEEFTSGNFEFGAQATAVALTAGVSAELSTKGNAAGVSGGQNNANIVGQYNKGMAVFTIAKGGLMYEASIGGQKFTYKAK